MTPFAHGMPEHRCMRVHNQFKSVRRGKNSMPLTDTAGTCYNSRGNKGYAVKLLSAGELGEGLPDAWRSRHRPLPTPCRPSPQSAEGTALPPRSARPRKEVLRAEERTQPPEGDTAAGRARHAG